MAKACIICIKEVGSGLAVADDSVISAIRAVKQRLNVAKNNQLVVCPACIEAYKKKRASYERQIALYMVIAAAIFVLLAILPILSSGFSIVAALYGLLFALAVMVIPILTSHTPKLAQDAGQEQGKPGASAARQKKARKK
jgi:hypothetical protein